MNMGGAPLLQVEDLAVHFETEEGTVQAVDGVSFTVESGESFGLVGESGAGKSVTALSIMDLVQKPPGKIVSGVVRFQGEDILSMERDEVREIRGNNIGMIFQDPQKSLNPVHTVGRQIAETVNIHQDVTEKQAQRRAVEMLEKVGIPDPDERVDEYPHQFSGGMQQRAMIAIALANNPELLIADEPTTSLDVTIEATILELLDDLQTDYDMSIILITHDLGVISEVCDRVGVMYSGKLVEEGIVREVYDNPHHPYTFGLVESIPTPHRRVKDLSSIEGHMPSGVNPPNGCRFHPRCPAAMPECKTEEPEIRRLNGRKVACHLHSNIKSDPGSAADVEENQDLVDSILDQEVTTNE